MNKYVLFPARHEHLDIEGLPSIFKETENPFDLECTDEFELSPLTESEIIYVTGNCYGLIEYIDIILNLKLHGDATECKELVFLHYNNDTKKYSTKQTLSLELFGRPDGVSPSEYIFNNRIFM